MIEGTDQPTPVTQALSSVRGLADKRQSTRARPRKEKTEGKGKGMI